MEGTSEKKAAVMAEGTVKWFNDSKGHGFITQADLSVNRDIIQGQGDGPRNLAVGDRGRYEVMWGATAPQATNVHKTLVPEPTIEQPSVGADPAWGSFFG